MSQGDRKKADSKDEIDPTVKDLVDKVRKYQNKEANGRELIKHLYYLHKTNQINETTLQFFRDIVKHSFMSKSAFKREMIVMFLNFKDSEDGIGTSIQDEILKDIMK